MPTCQLGNNRTYQKSQHAVTALASNNSFADRMASYVQIYPNFVDQPSLFEVFNTAEHVQNLVTLIIRRATTQLGPMRLTNFT